jgi:hypothetical protein
MRHVPLVLALLTVVVALLLRRSPWTRSSLWLSRLAYGGLVLQAPLYFLSKSGFRISSLECQWTFGLALARHSLTNYGHIVLFAVFFLLTYVQLPGVPKRMMWSAAATLAMGLVVEFAQGVSGHGHCRMRDIIPDSIGALIGWAIVSAGIAMSQEREPNRGEPESTIE